MTKLNKTEIFQNKSSNYIVESGNKLIKIYYNLLSAH